MDSALRVITALDFEIELFTKLVAGRLRTDPGYRAIQQIPGVGPVLAAVFVAEIGDIGRFDRPEQLASWAGLTPKHHGPTPPCTGAGSPRGVTAGPLGGGRGRGMVPATPDAGNTGTGSPHAAVATSGPSRPPAS